MIACRHTRGPWLALALLTGTLSVGEGVVASGAAASDASTTAVAADDSVDFWLDLLSAESAAIDSVLAALDAAAAPTRPDGSDTGALAWTGSLSAGYDAYSQTYALASTDTTETLREYEVVLAAVGATRGVADHRWRLAPRLSLGSERLREQLDAGWTWKPAHGRSTVDAVAAFQAVQYRGATDWNLSSDWRETEARLRWRFETEAGPRLELRGDGSSLRHASPSLLEVDRDEAEATFAVRSARAADLRWRVGAALGRRVHPDTTALDRTGREIFGSLEFGGFGEVGLRLEGSTERRDVEDETARPSSRIHRLAGESSLPIAADIELRADGAVEIWDYDHPSGFYQDQTLLTSYAGFHASPLDGPGWSLGVAWERLDSDDDEEPYGQMGVRGGLETYGRLTASATLEVGRRDYAADTADPADPDNASGNASGDLTDVVSDPLYTDFDYVEVWLDASFRLDERISLDAMLSWMPETHADDEDDQSLGFASLRAVYRF